jgi:hypothetical protein
LVSKVIVYRSMAEKDFPFVLSSWAESFRGSHYAGVLPFETYFEQHRQHLTSILNRKNVRCLVAVNPQEAEEKYEIYGYLVHELGHKDPVVHWVYVKHGVRENGVTKYLFNAAGIDPGHRFIYSFKTGDAIRVIRKRNLIARFDPWYAREDKHKRREEKAA